MAHKDFEDMCLDLFGEEHGDVALIPGPRRTGRDQATDGIYQGRLANHTGTWKIACAVRQDAKTLKIKIEIERKAALESGLFSAMLVMSSADVDAPAAASLAKMASRGLKRGLVWTRSSLERLLRKHPWVAATYFGHQVLPGFVPLESGQAHDVANQPDLQLIGREPELDRIRAFLHGSANLLLIVGPGGAGKSRLLRAIPRISRDTKGRRSSWLRQVGVGTIEEGLRAGLPTRRPMLLALDDAGRVIDEVRQLGIASRAPSVDIKVVLALRSADRELIASELREIGTQYEVVELDQLARKDLIEIVHAEAPELPQEVATQIARHFGANLFLLRAAAQLVRSGEPLARIIQPGELSSLVAQRIIREATGHLRFFQDEGRTRQLLLQAAVDVPIVSQPIGQELDTLRQAGLLRIVGRGLRFRADVEGDLLLGYLLEQPWARAWLDSHLRNDRSLFLNRVRNLAAVGTGYPAQVIGDLCLEWTAVASATDDWERARILDIMPRCVESAPEAVIGLCEAYARLPDKHTTDDFGPVIVALARTGRSVEALRLFQRLHQLNVTPGMYGNYKLPGMIEEIASLRHLSPENASVICDEIARALTGSESLAAEIASAVLNVFLAPTMRWDTSDAATFTMHEQELTPTKEVLNLRRRVIDLLVAMLVHGSADIRLAAAKVLVEHGHAQGRTVSASALDSTRDQEFKFLVPTLRERLAKEQDVAVIDALEEALVFRWAAQAPGAADAERLLRATEWPTLLRAVRFVSQPWDYYPSVVDAMEGAPDANRWAWWVERRSELLKTDNPADEAERLVGLLQRDHPGTGGLLQVTDALSTLERSPAPLLDVWCRKRPELFRSAESQATKESTRRVLAQVLRRHAFALPEFDPIGEMQRLLNHTTPVQTVEQYLRDMPNLASDTTVALARVLVSRVETEYRRVGLDLLQYRRDIDRATALDILEQALRDNSWPSVWHFAWSVLHDDAGKKALASRSSTRDVLEARLGDALMSGRWDANPNQAWYVEHVVDLLVGDDGGRRLALLARALVSKKHAPDSLGFIVKPLLQTPDTIRALCMEFAQLLEKGVVSDRSCARVLAHALDDRQLPAFAQAVGEDLLKAGPLDVRRAGVVLLSEMRNSPHVCAELVELAVGTSELRDFANAALANFTTPRGVYSGDVGRPPPALVSIQHVLERTAMLVRSPNALAKTTEMQRDVADRSDRNVQADQELLDPK